MLDKQIITIKEYVAGKQKAPYGIDGLGDDYSAVSHIFFLREGHLQYNEGQKAIVFDIGHYSHRDVKKLLEDIFLPLDEMCFNLVLAMEQQNITLILKNNIRNQPSIFFEEIDAFLSQQNIAVIKEGFWEKLII